MTNVNTICVITSKLPELQNSLSVLNEVDIILLDYGSRLFISLNKFRFKNVFSYHKSYENPEYTTKRFLGK